MARLVDATLWIDFGRARSSQSRKEFAAQYIFDPDACLAEPIMFEVLRYANEEETRKLQAQFQTLPMLTTPANVWSEATALGQRCRRHGITTGSLDLVIACIALHHDVELVTFDSDFERIATVCGLRVSHLSQPAD